MCRRYFIFNNDIFDYLAPFYIESNLIELDESTVKPIVENLISSLSVLRHWQETIVKSANSHRAIIEDGLLPRYFKKEISFTNKMGRQAINHLVQGTGAIILKRAIRKINDSSGTVKILLPMHDALLLQVSEQTAQVETQEMIKTLNQSFNEVLDHRLGMAVKKEFS